MISAKLTKVINIASLALIAILGGGVRLLVLTFFLNRYWEKKSPESYNKIAIKWISTLVKVLIWVIALILFPRTAARISTSLVTGLGVGGIAIAFAAQALLEDFFSFFSIFFDRPFEIGDFIMWTSTWAPWRTSESRPSACAASAGSSWSFPTGHHEFAGAQLQADGAAARPVHHRRDLRHAA